MLTWQYDQKGLLTIRDGDKLLVEVKAPNDLSLHDGMLHCFGGDGNPLAYHIGTAQPGVKYPLGGDSTPKPSKSVKQPHKALTASSIKAK